MPVGSDTGGVFVNRFQEFQGQLDGTGLDEILIGSPAPDVIIGYEGDDVLIGNDGTDTLVGGPGNDLLVGGAENDQFRMRTNTGTDIIRDFTDGAAGDDRIGFLDADPSVPGNFEFPNTFGSPEGTPLNPNDFGLHTSISNLYIVDNQSVVRITTAQTTAQITGGLGPGATNVYVFVFNSTTGHGEIWFDSDWGSTGSRVQVASFDNITTLAGINEITDLDIVVYSNPQGDPAAAPPPASSELEGDPTIPPPPPEEPAGFLAGPAFASMAAESDEDQASAGTADGISTYALQRLGRARGHGRAPCAEPRRRQLVHCRQSWCRLTATAMP